MMKNAGKSNQKSDQFRAKGNEFYARRSFFDAMVKYNESLCCAESGTQNLGLAYANRSAVFFEIKLYDKCLNNIKLARQNHYPEKNFDILKKREEKCTEAMKQQKDQNSAQNVFRLSQPANKTLPFVAECLELKNSKQFGRHIVTNRPLKVGDILAIEEPFCKVVHENFIHQKCSLCMNENLLDLLPCQGCAKGL
jgi:SET and MYND domain-containing protein 4